ncbi:MAG: iron ABC transporter permease [Planctomycetes bacterium]|nr:iron ABC transporter permease [Planctomycetota bacterium]
MRTARAWRRALVWLPFALVAFGPALYLIARSFFPQGGAFSLSAYAELFGATPGAAARRATLWNTLELAFSVVAATTLVGVPFGFLVARTDLRLARLYESLALVPLLLPPYLGGIAWVQVHPMRGLPAIVLILGGALFPVVALLAARAFREVGGELEDAARLSFGERGAFWRVTLPLARSGIAAGALLVFVFALSDFVVPDFFSFAVQGEATFQVFATEIYGAFVRNGDPIGATAYALPLVVLAGVALLLLARSEQRRSVASVQGSHVAPRPFALGRWQPLAQLFVVAVVATTALLPLFVLGRMALKPTSGPPPVAAPAVAPAASGSTASGTAATGPASGAVNAPLGRPVDLTVYQSRSPAREALQRYSGDVVASLRNALLGVLFVLLLAIGPARALARAPRVSPAARALVLLPFAFPSLLLGMAHEQLFLADAGLADRLYRGYGLVSLTFASRFLPLAVLGLAASWRRLSPELDEAAALARVSGATRFLRLRLPLLAPGLFAVGTLALGLMLREFDAIVLLPASQEMLTYRLYQLVHLSRDAVVGTLAWMQVVSVFVPWIALRLLAGTERR